MLGGRFGVVFGALGVFFGALGTMLVSFGTRSVKKCVFLDDEQAFWTIWGGFWRRFGAIWEPKSEKNMSKIDTRNQSNFRPLFCFCFLLFFDFLVCFDGFD